jgi:hypothetical protein
MERQSVLILAKEVLADNWGSSATVRDPFREAAEQKEARSKLHAAVHSGFLTRPDECSECGARPVHWSGSSQIQAHHDDYTKPLKVRWLCPSCHSKANRARLVKAGYQRPASYDFAEFLLATGEYTFPHSYDPPHDPDRDGDLIDRAIRSVVFAGFQTARNRQVPMVGLFLSCGHIETVLPSVLCSLPAYHTCHECSEANRRALDRRAERRRELYRARRRATP